ARLVIDDEPKINARIREVARVRRIVLLNNELDANDAELTRTHKVRRTDVTEKYAPVIAAFYSGGKEAELTVEITFDDGRKSQLTSTLLVHDTDPTSATVREAA